MLAPKLRGPKSDFRQTFPCRSCLNFQLRFGSSFGASWARCWAHFGRILGSNFGLRKVSKLKRPMCAILYDLQYETLVFDLPRGSEIEEKSMPKRLQDKSGFHEAKNHEKVSNIGSSWSPRSSQVASKSKLKTKVILSDQKTRGPVKRRRVVWAPQGVNPRAT